MQCYLLKPLKGCFTIYLAYSYTVTIVTKNKKRKLRCNRKSCFIFFYLNELRILDIPYIQKSPNWPTLFRIQYNQLFGLHYKFIMLSLGLLFWMVKITKVWESLCLSLVPFINITTVFFQDTVLPLMARSSMSTLQPVMLVTYPTILPLCLTLVYLLVYSRTNLKKLIWQVLGGLFWK